MKLKYLGLFAILLVSWSGSAESTESNLCDQDLIKAVYLKKVGDAAKKAKEEMCTANSQNDIDLAYIGFLNNIEGWFDPFGGFIEPKSIVEAIKSHITNEIPSVSVSLNLIDKIQVETESFEPRDKSKCIKVSSAPTCIDVLEEFIQLHLNIQNLQAETNRLEILYNIKKLRSEWEPFLEHMKGQTWLELLINRQVYKNNSDTFSGPPTRQWIFLHPTVLIENVAAAVDGENTQEALGIEIIGMNWWQQDKWYIPSGASLLAVYSDRADVKDTAYGVAFHFLSDYTVGYTNHDGDDGFFVSVDLIKLFQDKKNVYESYKSAFD